MSFVLKSKPLLWIPTLLSIGSNVPLLFSCEGFGRPLVGEFPSTERECVEAPPCDDPIVSLRSVLLRLIDIPAEIGNCDRTPQSCPSTINDTNSESGRLTNCEVTLDLKQLSSSELPLARSECARINLVSEENEPTDSSWVRLPNLDLAHKTFAISSRTPTVIELESASLNNVTFSIQGDVSLRIIRATKFETIRVLSERGSEGLPIFELIEVEGQHLVIGSESKAFEGLFKATRSKLEICGVFAQDVRLESVRVAKTIIDASILSGTDGSFIDTVIVFRHAILSASLLYRVEIPRCGSLTTVASTIETTRISACSGSPLRSYSTDMIDVSLSGSIEIDQGVWQKVRFGIREATSVVGWDFELTESTVCDESQSFRIGGNPILSCIRCKSESVYESDAVCLLPGTSPLIKGENCAAFIQPVDCSEPIPARTRP